MKFHSLRDRIESALTGEPGRPVWTRWLKAAAAISAITVFGAIVNLRLAPTNLAMLYLLGIVFICYRWGFGPALLLSLAGAFSFDFFFIPPYESFAISDLWYVVTALTFMCIAVLISILTAGVRRHALDASRRAENTAALYALTQALAVARRPEDVLRAAAQHIETRFGYETALFLADESGRLVTKLEPSWSAIDDSLRAATETAFHLSNPDPVAHRDRVFLPLRTAERAIGVIVLSHAHSHPAASGADDLVLEGIAGQVAIAIERAELEQQAREADVLRKADELQRTLLNSVSHSLRAPLAAILSALHLIAEGESNHARDVVELAQIARDEASRLDALIGNLLNLSRLEAGALKPRIEPRDLRDVFGAALRDLYGSEGREIRFKSEPRLPLVSIDLPLIIRVLVNLLENALKYSPAGSPIHVEAKLRGREVEVRVADRGCGVSAREREAIFNKFARGSGTGDAPGIGLGLPICKGFVEAHKGRIWVEERPGGGSVFCFTLPASDVHDHDLLLSGGGSRPTAESESWS